MVVPDFFVFLMGRLVVAGAPTLVGAVVAPEDPVAVVGGVDVGGVDVGVVDVGGVAVAVVVVVVVGVAVVVVVVGGGVTKHVGTVIVLSSRVTAPV